MLLTDTIIEHHSVTQLVLALVLVVLFQLEEPERQLLVVLSQLVALHLVLMVSLASLVEQYHIRLRHSLCCIRRNLSLEHSRAGTSHSCVPERNMRCSLVLERCMAGMYHSLELVCCMAGRHWHSDFEQHNGGSGGENHND